MNEAPVVSPQLQLPKRPNDVGGWSFRVSVLVQPLPNGPVNLGNRYRNGRRIRKRESNKMTRKVKNIKIEAFLETWFLHISSSNCLFTSPFSLKTFLRQPRFVKRHFPKSSLNLQIRRICIATSDPKKKKTPPYKLLSISDSNAPFGADFAAIPARKPVNMAAKTVLDRKRL